METFTSKLPESFTFSLNENGFTFRKDEGGPGVMELGLELDVEGNARKIVYTECKENSSGFRATGQSAEGLLECVSDFSTNGKPGVLTAAHTFRNKNPFPVRISNVRTGQFTPDSGVSLGKIHMFDARYCHTDNTRVERYPMCNTDYPWVRSLPSRTVHLGIGEDQPFPAIYFTDRRYTAGLVIGAVSQNNTFQTWEIKKTVDREKPGEFSVYVLHHEFPQVEYLTIEPGKELKLDPTYYQASKDTHPENCFDDYVDYISERHSFLGKKTLLKSQAFYCSWNYGRLGDQFEDDLLKSAKVISEKLPNVKFYLLDAGYTSLQKNYDRWLQNAFTDRFYPDANANIDPKKFPEGIRSFSDKIRELGLRPGIWWSPQVLLDSDLVRKHPEWMLRENAGKIYEVSQFGFLDLTLEPVQQFIDKTLSVILGEWNMDALKMDFWSQQFENRSVKRAPGNKTGLDARKTLFETIRKYLPDDGLFMTCCAVGMGNPFIGQHADTYRCGADIGNGTWTHQVHSSEWSLPTILVEGRKTFLLNADGLGFNPDSSHSENLFRLTWGIITQGMIEIDGYMDRLDDEQITALRKLTDRCDQGFKCKCPDEKAYTGYPLPEVLHVDFPEGSKTTKAGVKQMIALFNWTDSPKIISVERKKLGQQGKQQARNFWTDKDITLEGEFISQRLDPHSAMLLDVLA